MFVIGIVMLGMIGDVGFSDGAIEIGGMYDGVTGRKLGVPGVNEG